jgi:hypothetical protein
VAREWKPVGELTLAGGDQLHPENLLLKQETHGSTSERHVVQDVLDLFCGSSVNISSDRSWLVGRQFLYSVQHVFCAGIYRVLNMSSSFDLGYVYIYVQNVTSRASDIFEQAKLWGVQLVDVFVHEYNDHVLGVGRWLVETTDNIGASIGRLIQILLNWAGVERNPGPDGPRRGRGGRRPQVGSRSGGRQRLLENAVALLADQAAGERIARADRAREQEAPHPRNEGPEVLHGRIRDVPDVVYRDGTFAEPYRVRLTGWIFVSY